MMKNMVLLLITGFTLGLLYATVKDKTALDKKHYHWKELHLSIERPDGWEERLHWSEWDVGQFLEAAEKKDQKQLTHLNKIPLILMVKDGMGFKGFMPQFSVTVGLAGEKVDGIKIVENVINQYQKQFQSSFKVIVAPEIRTISGFTGGYIQVVYPISTDEGVENIFPGKAPSKKVISRVIEERFIISHKDLLISIKMKVRSDERNGTLEELHGILKNLRLESF